MLPKPRPTAPGPPSVSSFASDTSALAPTASGNAAHPPIPPITTDVPSDVPSPPEPSAEPSNLPAAAAEPAAAAATRGALRTRLYVGF